VTGAIRLLIADDHPVVRDGLRGIFEANGGFEVVGEAANGREAVDRAAALRPDVVLMDLRMPELDGVSAIRALTQRGIDARVLVLTTFDTDTDVLPAIEAGATGYLLKDSPPEELRRGVRAAARGEAVLSPSVATRLVGQVREPAREPLSQRELDILGLIARGCSNREAAARLFISEATVKTHVLHIYAKLGVNDRAAAVAVGFERGLLPRPLKPATPVPAHARDPVLTSGHGLPGEDLADLPGGIVRVPVEHRLQVMPLGIRRISGQLTFQFRALRAGRAGKQRGGHQQQEPGQEKHAAGRIAAQYDPGYREHGPGQQGLPAGPHRAHQRQQVQDGEQHPDTDPSADAPGTRASRDPHGLVRAAGLAPHHQVLPPLRSQSHRSLPRSGFVLRVLTMVRLSSPVSSLRCGGAGTTVRSE
jgi:DNA-binding NarL/FixJ family response regulator